MASNFSKSMGLARPFVSANFLTKRLTASMLEVADASMQTAEDMKTLKTQDFKLDLSLKHIRPLNYKFNNTFFSGWKHAFLDILMNGMLG